MATTYTLISSNVLSSAAASVTFSSIPATYTDLVLRISARTDTTTTLILMSFNGDTSGVWSRTSLRGNGSAASSGDNTALARMQLENVNISTYTASTFNSMEVYIPNYTTTAYKQISNFGVSETNATAANMAASAGLWQLGSAITSIELSGSTANFVTGSSFYLYGIKSS
jgi:hypothetical protein